MVDTVYTHILTIIGESSLMMSSIMRSRFRLCLSGRGRRSSRREGGREGERGGGEGGGEGGRGGGREESGREGGREGGIDGGREGRGGEAREGGREGGRNRDGGSERGRGREGGTGDYIPTCIHTMTIIGNTSQYIQCWCRLYLGGVRKWASIRSVE